MRYLELAAIVVFIQGVPAPSPCDNYQCPPSRTCVMRLWSPRCVCCPGTVEIGTICFGDKKLLCDCLNCQENQECRLGTNTGLPECYCPDGFATDELGHCHDPCDNCAKKSKCTNQRCECQEGHILVDGECVIDVCPSCPPNSQCIFQQCFCNPGYVRVDEKCEKDGCVVCPKFSSCKKNKCVCIDGYTMIKGDCVESCKGCPENSQCIGKKCVCNAGFVSKRGKCVGRCPTPKVYTRCAPSCPKTCLTRNEKQPKRCQECRRGRNCVCPPGWVEKNFGDSTCVKESDCQARDPCDYIRCHENSVCDRPSRSCKCKDGYRTAGFQICRRI